MMELDERKQIITARLTSVKDREKKKEEERKNRYNTVDYYEDNYGYPGEDDENVHCSNCGAVASFYDNMFPLCSKCEDSQYEALTGKKKKNELDPERYPLIAQHYRDWT